MRWVGFDGSDAQRFPEWATQAMIKIDGKWRLEDWTSSPQHAFCMDRHNQRIKELMLVFSNGAWKNRSPIAKPKRQLSASNAGCWRWTGDVTATNQLNDRNNAITDEVTASEMTFERSDDSTSGQLLMNDTVNGGSVAWSQHGTMTWGDNVCTGQGSSM